MSAVVPVPDRPADPGSDEAQGAATRADSSGRAGSSTAAGASTAAGSVTSAAGPTTAAELTGAVGDELDDLARRPLAEHPDGYERIHARLQESLAGIDDA